MSEYRYVVFPRGKQPTVDEIRQFHTFAGALAGQFAIGVCRDDDRLAIAFDRRTFDHVSSSDAGFERLLHKWLARGCEIVDRLGFVKDPAALRPTPVNLWQGHDGRESVAVRRIESQIADKQLRAREAVAHSLLRVEGTLQRYALLQRLAAATPYALVALAAASVIAVGFYVRHRLATAGPPPRREIIERVVDDPWRDALADESDGGGRPTAAR